MIQNKFVLVTLLALQGGEEETAPCPCSVYPNPVVLNAGSGAQRCQTTIQIVCQAGKCPINEPTSTLAGCTYKVNNCAGDCCDIIAITNLTNTVWINCTSLDPLNSPGVNLGGLQVPCGHTYPVWFLAVSPAYCNENALNETLPAQVLVSLTCGLCNV